MTETTQVRPPANSRSVSELVEDATTQLSRLIRDELQLARVEMREKGKRFGLGAGLAGVAALLAFYGGAALVAAAVLGLTEVLPGWASALIVAGALLVVAAVLGLAGKKSVAEASPPIPREAVDGVREDIEVIKDRRRG
ncbi:phage holin family protein [Nocardia implantans]|uniref:Phage holin family protein n=1 Tax=Nocardia implantans TaxID=3108168 RepID=A0ABU6AVL6_9NOCA|nr:MULTISPECIES: phage holin family protein [unclassified Nocardia]MBF6192476.1 phage holin family protein [Nocardia beijingensis]MEA3527619.1 phage holin family protein [Nocardia sp. CDC192]MEB3511327.1 phage holin family protein [Nocardia sp. CDC186]